MRKGEPVTAAGPARPRWWLVAAALAMVLGAGSAHPVSLGTSASVTILSPLATSSDQDLRFGALSAQCDYDDGFNLFDRCPGTVVITTAGGRTATGSSGNGPVDLLPDSPFGPAVFTISGTPGASYTIILPGGSLTAQRADPPVELGSPCVDERDADTLTVSTASNGTGLTGQIGAGGTDTVFVGGTLQVVDGFFNWTCSGTYTANVPLTVAYQ